MHQRQLSFILQYTTSIQYLPGCENPVAHALSRIDSIALAHSATAKDPITLATSLTAEVTLQQISAEQSKDEELKIILADNDHPLILKRLTWDDSFTPTSKVISSDHTYRNHFGVQL